MKKYFEKYGEPEVAFNMIKKDLKGAMKAVESGEKIEHTDLAHLKNASDSTFMNAYEEHVKGSIPDKLAAVVAKVTDLAESLDINLEDFLGLIERYCSLKNPQSNRKVVRYL